ARCFPRSSNTSHNMPPSGMEMLPGKRQLREEAMKLTRRLFAASALICASVAAFAVGTLVIPDGAAAEGTKRIGVSWRHFQEERWRIDEAGIKSVLEPAGYEYVSADAQADPQKQLTDVESLLASGVD